MLSVGGERHDRLTVDVRRHRAVVHVEVLDLARDIADEARLDTAADRPAGIDRHIAEGIGDRVAVGVIDEHRAGGEQASPCRAARDIG